MLRTRLGAATAAAALCVAFSVSAASPRLSPRDDAPHSVQPPYPAGTLHVPVGTINNYSTSSAALPGNVHSATDKPTKFTCAQANGCTILASAMVSITSGAANNIWRICTVVDDVYANDTCFNQSPMATVGQYYVGNAKSNVSVAQGKHVISTQIYTINDATLGAYDYTYEITTP